MVIIFHYGSGIEMSWRGIYSVNIRSVLSHGGYPKDFINEHLAEAHGYVHILLKTTLPSGVEVVATGAAGAGSATAGEPYEMRPSDG